MEQPSITEPLMEPSTSRTTTPWINPWPSDVCDCDERCDKCGKKKKQGITWILH